MGTVVQFRDLRLPVVEALQLLSQSSADQRLIQVGAEACEVEWAPDTYFHHSLLLPLALLTAAIDEGAAKARWQAVSLVDLAGAATMLDSDQRSMLVTLAGAPVLVEAGPDHVPIPRPGFARELVDWIDRFDLDATAFSVDRTTFDAGNGPYAVRPSALMNQMPRVIKPLRSAQQLATVVVLSLYNRSEARAAFNGKAALVAESGRPERFLGPACRGWQGELIRTSSPAPLPPIVAGELTA